MTKLPSSIDILVNKLASNIKSYATKSSESKQAILQQARTLSEKLEKYNVNYPYRLGKDAKDALLTKLGVGRELKAAIPTFCECVLWFYD